MKKMRVGVCGASGYAGMELLKILKRHSQTEVVFLTSESHKNVKVGDFDPSLVDYQDFTYVSMEEESIYQNVDAVFLALPHEASALAAPKFLNKGIKVIDLSAAFRLRSIPLFEKVYKFKHHSAELVSKAVYGLTEIYREEIKKANLIANPGCYPTSALLPLIPLLKSKIIAPDHIIIDAKSGFSGRGRKADIPGLFIEMNENFYAYGIAGHRHKPEINQELSSAFEGKVTAAFTPHVLPVDRGIFSTIYIPSKENIAGQVLDEWEQFYQGEPFIRIYRKDLPQLKWVAHTNNVFMSAVYDEETQNLIVVSLIDNLVKGAAGQAVQNMNVMFGIEETEGLR
jgi:N-acetyl-gamma-glutamyl-phosphate reductase